MDMLKRLKEETIGLFSIIGCNIFSMNGGKYRVSSPNGLMWTFKFKFSYLANRVSN